MAATDGAPLRLVLAGATATLLNSALPHAAQAAVLPEDRSDLMYHYYDGGGVKVRGPALLVRKGIQDQVSVSASYYVDSISSASIDVVTSASPYSEKRKEYGVGVDYLYRDSLLSLSYTDSEESDYDASTVSFDVAQEVFGGMTTISLGYSRGSDTVGRSDDPGFAEPVDRWQYRLGVTQVLTRSLLASVNYEAISDQGFLNNPYRSARVAGTTVPERYPETRSSHAVALRAVGYLEPRSALRGEYRYYWDTWEIRGNTLEFAYSRHLDDQWLGEAYFRHYSQTHASFYSDSFAIEMSYMARDKELSTFTSQAIGFKASYQLGETLPFLDRATVNAGYEHIRFRYDDFTDVRTGGLYAFNANVVQLFLSAWY